MTNEYALDEFDKQLLKILVDDGRKKNTEIARIMNVTEGAIRKRIKKLKDAEFIEKFTVKLNERKLTGTLAIVNIEIDGNSSPSIITEKIEEHVKGVESIYETAGDVDLIVVFNSHGDGTLKIAIEELSGIQGVVSTKTYIALSRTKIERDIFS